MPQLAYDKGSRRFDGDGRMHVDNCRIGRACVSPYFGREIPNHQALGLDPNRIYRMYRDPTELERAADSFANLPLLIKHVPTTADKPANEFWVGTTGSNVKYVDGYLVTDTLSVWTDEAIGYVISKKQEQLSPSYNYRPDMTPGKTPDGQAYDGVMRDIRGNHVALVEQGRQGPSVAVADSHPGVTIMKPRFPALAAALAAVLPTATPAQLQAFDAALAQDMGLDCGLSAEDQRAAEDAYRASSNMAADAALSDEDRRKAYDSWKTRVGNRTTIPPTNPASDARPAGVTQAELAAAVTAATEAGAQRATERLTALHNAQRAVEPILGVVAMDSAEDVYKAALTKMNVDITGLPAAAYKATFDALNKQRIANPAPVRTGPPAFDAANRANTRAAIPVFGNVRVLG
jgi:uncharacterized protein